MVDFKKGESVRLKDVEDFPENDVFNKILNNRGWDIHFNMGYEVEDAGHNIKLDGVKGWWMRECFEFVLPAVEPIPAPEPEIPVLFVFIGEVNRKADGKIAMFNSYGMESFSSLEAAQEYCVGLRVQHATDNVHAYVRVEE